jgi:RNA polymerase sigma factor (sigma-70 family)
MSACPAVSRDLQTTDMTTLLRMAQTAEPGCWEEVVRRYGALVKSTVARFRLDSAHHADAVQSTWLRLFEKACTIREPERVGAWLVTTARRECLALIAIERRERATETRPWEERASTDATPEAVVLSAVERQAVRSAAAEITGRSALLLDALLAPTPVSYAEISARLDMPVGSIGPTRARIMRSLRAKLGAER